MNCSFPESKIILVCSRTAPSRKAIGATPGVPADDSTDDGTSSDEYGVMTSSPVKSNSTTSAMVSFEVGQPVQFYPLPFPSVFQLL